MNKNFEKKVGFFQNYTSQSAVARPLHAVIEIVTSDTMRRITEGARMSVLYNEQSHKKEATEYYNDIKVHHTPAVQPSLLYDNDGVRKSAKTCPNINEYASGIICVEVDNINPCDVERLKYYFITRPYVFFTAASLSGCGAYAFIEYDTNNPISGVFEALKEELNEELMINFGEVLDGQCKDATRFRGLAYDVRYLTKETNSVYTKCVVEEAKEVKVKKEVHLTDFETQYYYRWEYTPCVFRHLNHTERLRLFACVNAIYENDCVKVDEMWRTLMNNMQGGKHSTQHYINEPVKGKWSSCFCFLDKSIYTEAGFSRHDNVIKGLPKNFGDFLKRK